MIWRSISFLTGIPWVFLLVFTFSGTSALAVGPVPPNEAAILDMILKDHPHRLVTGQPAMVKDRPGVTSAIWDPDQSFRADFLEPQGDVATEIVTSKIVRTKGVTHMFVVTSTNTEQNYFHACAPAIGCSEFEFDGNNWQLKTNLLKVDLMGTYGRPFDMKLIAIGPDKWGIAAEHEYAGQGRLGGSFLLYLATDCRPGLIFDVATLEDTERDLAGMFSEFTYLKAKVTFLPCKSCEYYDIQVVTQYADFKANAREKFVQVGPKRVEKIRYSFQGDQYRPVK